jgi:hypothetical protein
MRRTTIKPLQMYSFANEFLSTIRYPRVAGRPRIYDDALIITIACVQNLYSFSFREALEFCADYFPDLPVLSTYHYRLQRIHANTITKFIEFLGTKIQAQIKQKVRLFIVDGTGFSYKDAYPVKFYRGTEIRKIRAHVKVGAIAAASDKKRFILSAMAGPPYTHDIKLVEPLLPVIRSNGYVLGDRGFDCIRFLEKIIFKLGCFPAIDIKQGLRYSIRNELRKFSKHFAGIKTIYSKRTLIEGLFGNTKQALGSHIRTFNQKIAKIFALLRFALFNMAALVGLKKSQLWIWIFEQPSFYPLHFI